LLTTPQVQYGYVEGQGMNTSRLVSLTYPNGRQVSYKYTSAVDNAISRVDAVADGGGVLEQYSYLGLDTLVQKYRPQIGGGLSYLSPNGQTGDAGDPYTGLDRFGRVVEQRWTSSAGVTDDFVYGYDRNGNALYRANQLNHNFDELYHASGAGQGYDNFNEITAFARGVLSASVPGGPLGGMIESCG
jgi:hypothetical protein